ncbi:relaxase/mobilization nuclease domain-containing protein [Loktanella sp. Alg231-35]|uniref:relaxase/mobilization nuclease domain-containing protein n=1 Tax=Loktanella sp. Alg231-35 TaxID=1922220 RepID=UPI000D561E4A|nr:relaxase/mobilization nuclease domain-containing protein [Loktanella sp. Alg231-35]
MARSNAVQVVSGELFQEGWSRVRGSMQGLGQKRQQMVRAAFGHRAAVFKAIRHGGTHTKGQLSNQLNYLTTKSSHIIDSRGIHDGKKTLNQDEIKSLVQQFTNRWDKGFNPKLGHTSHMLMSFPRGTTGEHVRDIAAGVCERFFQNDERNFDYIIAVHQDRDHPHAHVVLNRRSQEGELFYLGRDHHFNYDDLRLAMVEEAERHGVRLEATRRVHRGVADYAPRTREVYEANAEGREAVQRERIGSDLDRALADIASNAMIYRSLAVEASGENREDIENALLKASEILARNGHLKQNGDVYMATELSFDDLNSKFSQELQRVSAMISEAPDGQRAAMQKQLSSALQPVAHMQPLGLRSSTLNQAPTATGVYSETNINTDLVGKLRENETRAHVETALRGTGISSEAVIDRIEQGANSAALERQWYADDLQKIAENYDLNLERQEDLRVAADKLDQAHVALGSALERAEVIRRDGVVDQERDAVFHNDGDSVDEMSREVRQDLRGQGLSEAEIEQRVDEITIRAEVRLEQEQSAYIERHPELLARPGDVIDTSDPTNTRIVDQDRADAIDREIDEIIDRADSTSTLSDAISADMKQRYPDMPDHLARGIAVTYVASFETNNRDEIIEAERLSARDEVGRHELAERLANAAGVERTEREGIAASERSLISEVERGVADQFDGRANEFTKFEPLIVHRGSVNGDNTNTAVSALQLAADRREGRLDALDEQRADALLRDTMRDYDHHFRGADLNDEQRANLEALRLEYVPVGVNNTEIARVVEHERVDKINSPFADAQSRESYRSEIERELDDAQIEALRDGDADALGDVIDNRLDRLYAAKAYLQSDEATANSDAVREVVSEINEEEFDAHRLKAVPSHNEKGQTHG